MAPLKIQKELEHLTWVCRSSNIDLKTFKDDFGAKSGKCCGGMLVDLYCWSTKGKICNWMKNHKSCRRFSIYITLFCIMGPVSQALTRKMWISCKSSQVTVLGHKCEYQHWHGQLQVRKIYSRSIVLLRLRTIHSLLMYYVKLKLIEFRMIYVASTF